MKAALIHAFGNPSVIKIEEIERPAPKDDEALIQVHGSSINHSDLGLRNGDLKLITFWRLPLVLGFDISGEVIECGPEVTAFLPGDNVYALIGLKAGGNAEYVCVSQDKLSIAPSSIPLSDAAAVPLAGLTALQALRAKAHIHQKSGKRLLINGASGGVGSFAIQLAKFFGCHVTAVASSIKLKLMLQLGADEVIDYKSTDITQSKEKWDMIFDVAGTLNFSHVTKVLPENGVMVSTKTSPQGILNLTISSIASGPSFTFLMTKESGQDLSFLAQLIDKAKIIPTIDQVFSLNNIASAHTYSESEEAKGKVVIKIID